MCLLSYHDWQLVPDRWIRRGVPADWTALHMISFYGVRPNRKSTDQNQEYITTWNNISEIICRCSSWFLKKMWTLCLPRCRSVYKTVWLRYSLALNVNVCVGKQFKKCSDSPPTPLLWRYDPIPGYCLPLLDFAIITRNTTHGSTPLDECSAPRTDIYLTTHNTQNKHPCLRRNSNPQFQQASNGRPTP